MGVFAVTSAFIYSDGCDFTGTADDLTVRATADQREKTTFRSNGWREHHNTLKVSAVSTGGFWSSDTATDVDPTAFANLGVANSVMTAGLVETEGQVAHLMRNMEASYNLPEGSVGDLGKYRVEAVGSDGSVGQVRGKLFKEFAAVSATGATGTAIELGAVGAAQFLYGAFHVFGTPGTTITAVLESDADNSFASPTTRITFGPITTAGATWATPIAGAITDTWWRLNVTVITGTFTIACAAGIR